MQEQRALKVVSVNCGAAANRHRHFTNAVANTL